MQTAPVLFAALPERYVTFYTTFRLCSRKNFGVTDHITGPHTPACRSAGIGFFRYGRPSAGTGLLRYGLRFAPVGAKRASTGRSAPPKSLRSEAQRLLPGPALCNTAEAKTSQGVRQIVSILS